MRRLWPPWSCSLTRFAQAASSASTRLRVAASASGVRRSTDDRSRKKSPGLVCSGHANPSAPKYETMSAVAPKYAARPLRSSSVAPKCASTSALGWCIVASTVRPRAATAASVSTRFRVVKASRPVVGSSQYSSAGSVTSWQAVVTRRASPPLMPRTRCPPTRVSATSLRPSSVMSASTTARLCWREADAGSLSRAAKRSVSRTVRNGSRKSVCST